MIYVCLALLAFIAWREHTHNAERERLLQRVQAPEIAVRQFAGERKPARTVPIDDDAAYAEARERRLNGQRD